MFVQGLFTRTPSLYDLRSSKCAVHLLPFVLLKRILLRLFLTFPELVDTRLIHTASSTLKDMVSTLSRNGPSFWQRTSAGPGEPRLLSEVVILIGTRWEANAQYLTALNHEL